MGLDGTAPRSDEELRFNLEITHGILNVLHAGFQGKFVATSIEAQIAGRSPELVEINVLKSVLDEIGRWTKDLWAGRPLLGREGKRHPSTDAPVALELLDELRADLVAFIPRLEDAIFDGGRDAPAAMVMALGRHAYGHEHYVNGLVEWGEKFGPRSIADRSRQQLLVCQSQIARAHHFLHLARDNNLDAAAMIELLDSVVLLPGIFRTQIHDMYLLVGRRRGAISYSLIGIEKSDAEQWKQLGLGADAAGYWRCYGFGPAEAGEWIEAGFATASHAAAWSLRGFGLDEAVELHNAGVDAGKACRERSRSA